MDSTVILRLGGWLATYIPRNVLRDLQLVARDRMIWEQIAPGEWRVSRAPAKILPPPKEESDACTPKI